MNKQNLPLNALPDHASPPTLYLKMFLFMRPPDAPQTFAMVLLIA
jgi:hypothetical protein